MHFSVNNNAGPRWKSKFISWNFENNSVYKKVLKEIFSVSLRNRVFSQKQFASHSNLSVLITSSFLKCVLCLIYAISVCCRFYFPGEPQLVHLVS